MIVSFVEKSSRLKMICRSTRRQNTVKLSPTVQMTNVGMDKKSAGLGTCAMKKKY